MATPGDRAYSLYLRKSVMKDLKRTEAIIVRQENRAATTSPGKTASNSGCVRIIVADDHAHIRKLMEFIFNSVSGYTVRFAKDGEDAWTTLCAEPFDLLITDIDMPRLDGIQLVRRMRQHSFQQPVIFISGSLPDDASGLFQSLTPCDGLEKPFSFAEMLTIAAAISHCKAPNGTNRRSRNGTNGSIQNGTNGSSHNGTNGSSSQI